MGPQAATSSPVSPCVHNSHVCLFSHAPALLPTQPSSLTPLPPPRTLLQLAKTQPRWRMCVCSVCMWGTDLMVLHVVGTGGVCMPSLERRCRQGPHSSGAGLPLHAAVLLEFSTFELRPLASPRPSHPLGWGRWVSLNVYGYRKTLQIGKALQGDGDPGGSGIQGPHGHSPG